MASRLQSLMKSRRSTSTISVFLGFVLTDVTVYPAAVPLFNRAHERDFIQNPHSENRYPTVPRSPSERVHDAL
jgi:hypothetical protein